MEVWLHGLVRRPLAGAPVSHESPAPPVRPGVWGLGPHRVPDRHVLRTCRGCRANFALPGRGAAPHTSIHPPSISTIPFHSPSASIPPFSPSFISLHFPSPLFPSFLPSFIPPSSPFRFLSPLSRPSHLSILFLPPFVSLCGSSCPSCFPGRPLLRQPRARTFLGRRKKTLASRPGHLVSYGAFCGRNSMAE